VFNAQGFGFLEPYDSNTRSISFDTSKTFHFLGQHTVSVGYTWQFPNIQRHYKIFWQVFPLPQSNASGGDPGYDTSTTPVAGKTTNAR